MLIQNQWRGPGNSYEDPDPQMSRMTSNQISRFKPFRDAHNSRMIMVNGANNQAQSDSLAVQTAATESAATRSEALSKNFRSK